MLFPTYLDLLPLNLVCFVLCAFEVLLVVHWTTDHYYHLSLNLNMCISEGCFIFDFASLPLEVTRPI